MSSLSRGVFVALCLLSRDAWGQESTPSLGSRLHDVDASVRVGYGSVFTDGLPYLGVGYGGALGYHVTRRLRLEATLLHGVGSAIEAKNASLDYRSKYSSTHATLGAGYDIVFGALTIRPTIRAGVRFVEGKVAIGNLHSHDEQLYTIVGPALVQTIRIGLLELGIDGEAFFLPTWPAAPSVGLYGIAGVAF